MSTHSSWQSSTLLGSPTPRKTLFKYAATPLLSPREHGKRFKSFKPTGHNTAVLFFYAVVVLGLIGALEYGMRVLPPTSSDVHLNANLVPGPQRQARSHHVERDGSPHLEERQPQFSSTSALYDPSQSTIMPQASYLNPTVQTIRGPSGSTSSPEPPASKPLDSYLNPDGTTITMITVTTPTTTTAADTTTSTMSHSPTSSSSLPSSSSSASVSTSLGLATTKLTSPPSTQEAVTTALTTVSLGHPAPESYMNPTRTVEVVVTSFFPPSSTVTSSGSLPAITLPPNVMDSTVPLTLVVKRQNYFFGVYLPVILATIVRLLYGYLYRCTKLVDPFFMLSNSEGASAPDLFRADFLGSEPIFAPFIAFRSRRWLLLWTSVVYAAAQLLLPLASELTSIYNSNFTIRLPKGFAMVRGQALWINPVIGRLMQALLSFILIMTLMIWFKLRKHESGIASNPSSICTVASIMNHPITAEDFATLDQMASKKTINRALADRRYRLGYYFLEGSEQYGIVPVETTFDFNVQTEYTGLSPSTRWSTPKAPLYNRQPLNENSCQRSKGDSIKTIAPLILLTCAAVALFGVVLAYYLNAEENAFEQFMGSQNFGPRFILSVLGLLIKSPVLSMCTDSVASVPFARLAHKARFADPDLFSTVPLTPLGSVWYALRRGQIYVAALALAAGLLVEALLVLLPGVPFHATQVWEGSLASWYGCLAALAAIILVAIAAWVRLFFFVPRSTRRRSTDTTTIAVGAGSTWPLSPCYVGSVCAYVAGSRMTADYAASLAAAQATVEMEVEAGSRINSKGYSVKRNAALKMWLADLRSWGATYSFARRAEGRWTVEYADSTTALIIPETPSFQASFPSDDDDGRHGAPGGQQDLSRFSRFRSVVQSPEQMQADWPLAKAAEDVRAESRSLMSK